MEWINSFCESIEKINTNYELQKVDAIYTVVPSYDYPYEVSDYRGNLYNEETAMKCINTIIPKSALSVFICTTDKGNYYGISNGEIKNKPEIAKLFNKRVRGVQHKVFTNSIDNIKEYLNRKFKGVTYIDRAPNKEDGWKCWYYSTRDLAKQAAEVLTAVHRTSVITNWYKAKLEELKKGQQQNYSNLEYYKQKVAEVGNDISAFNNTIEYYNDKLAAIEEM
jgi:hypothetical protein